MGVYGNYGQRLYIDGVGDTDELSRFLTLVKQAGRTLMREPLVQTVTLPMCLLPQW